MVRIDHSVTIRRPIAEVWEFAANPENDVKSRSGVLRFSLTSDGPIGVDSSATEVLEFPGRRVEATWEVTEFRPIERFAFMTRSGHVSLEGTVSFESEGDGTRVVAAVQGESGGFLRVAEPLLARIARRRMENDHRTLKNILEAAAEDGVRAPKLAETAVGT